MPTKKLVDTRDEILDYLKEIERPLSWIAKPNTTLPYGSLYSIFQQRVMELTQEKLDIINQRLQTNFTLPK